MYNGAPLQKFKLKAKFKAYASKTNDICKKYPKVSLNSLTFQIFEVEASDSGQEQWLESESVGLERNQGRSQPLQGGPEQVPHLELQTRRLEPERVPVGSAPNLQEVSR